MKKISKFKEISKKNFILLWRSKKTVLTIFFGPLILIFLLGLAFNNIELNKLSVAIYSEQYNKLSNSLLDRLEANNFAVLKIETKSKCIDNIKLGKNHLCIIIPANFEVDQNNELTIYLDRSKINLVENVINLFSYSIEGESSKLSLDLTETLLDALNQVGLLGSDSNSIVSELKKTNSGSTDTARKMIEELNKIDITINESISKIDDLQSKIQQGADSKKTINDILDLIDKSRDLIDSIRNNIDPSLRPDLDSIDAYLKEAEDEFEKSDIFDKDYWNNLDLLADDLKDSIITAKDLELTLSGEIGLIKQDLINSLTNLNNLQINLNKINSMTSNIKIKNATKIVNPIVTNIKPIVPEKSHLNYIFPTLLVLIIMFGSVLLSSTASIVEKTNSAFFRNFISPTNKLYFLIARYLTDFVIVLFQLSIFLGISLIFLKIQAFSGLSMAVIILMAISFFILLGILIGCICNSEESSVLFSIVITSIMLFFSNTILPMERMANIIYKISQFNPLVLSEAALRKSIIYGSGINLISKEIISLAIWIILIVGTIFFINKLNMQRIRDRIKKIIFVDE